MSNPPSQTDQLDTPKNRHQPADLFSSDQPLPDSAGDRRHHLFDQQNESLGKSWFQSDGNPRISILGLMALTGSIAVGVNAILQLGLVGPLVLFAGCALISTLTRPNHDRPANRRFWTQYYWAIFMPLACIFGDQFVFGTFEYGRPQQFNSLAIPSYVFIGWQIFFLITSWFITTKRKRLNGFLSGTFFAGSFFAMIIGICLTPLALIGTLVLIGVLGLVPWFSALSFYRTAQLHLRRSRNSQGRSPKFFTALGFIIPIAVWLLLLVLCVAGLIDPNDLLSLD